MMHTLNLSVQYADTTKNWMDVLPRPTLRRWVQSALQVNATLTIRFVDEEEGRQLNAEFRGKDYATNVLTFTYDDELDDLPEEVRAAIAAEQGEQIEADIILCGAVLEREATEQGKTIVEHAAHLVVHGVLHAQGFDHIEDEEAEIMEGLERQIVMKLGFSDPYLELAADSTN